MDKVFGLGILRREPIMPIFRVSCQIYSKKSENLYTLYGEQGS